MERVHDHHGCSVLLLVCVHQSVYSLSAVMTVPATMRMTRMNKVDLDDTKFFVVEIRGW